MPGTLSVVQDAATSLLVRAQKVDFEGLADAVSKLIAELRGSLRDGDVHGTLTQASATLAALRGALAAADIPGLTTELRSTLAAAKGLAQGPQTRELLRSGTIAADRLAQATAKLPPLLASLDAVARRADSGSADLEAALTPLLRDARVSLTALREMTQALRRDPAQIILQGPPPREAAP
jgi:paraquat-inducible protein B